MNEMETYHCYAALDSAKLAARNEDERTVRRVIFALSRTFDIDTAMWLGSVACDCRRLLQARSLDKFEQPIDAWRGWLEMSGTGGNARILCDGVAAVASMTGKDETEKLTVKITLEAFPEALFLTFLAASLKETVEVTFKREQTSIRMKDEPEPAAPAEKKPKEQKQGSLLTASTQEIAEHTRKGKEKKKKAAVAVGVAVGERSVNADLTSKQERNAK